MEFLPRTLGTRPRLACEVRAEGVVAARAEDATGVLAAVSRVLLSDSGAPDRAATVAAVRSTLEAVVLRDREITLVVPDAVVRVLLLDFDALPSKLDEALPVVRFRLKKLLPFDADDAAVSYQVMETTRNLLRVVAVAMPREVLLDYEAIVREAGFEPGAILPSTLAALAGYPVDASPVLLVNAGRHGVTTAIVRAGVLLLHRSVDLRAEAATAAPHLGDTTIRLPLVDREASAEEWALQEPTALPSSADLLPELVQTALIEHDLAVEHEAGIAASEVAQTVSRTAAYFEDTLEAAPRAILATGTMGAPALAAVLEGTGVGPLPVREMVEPGMLGPGASSGRVPLGWLAGVKGALTD